MTSLSGRKEDKITEKDVYGEGSSEPFLPKQQASIDFIYLPLSEHSSDNPYATRAAYNPSYKPTLNDTAGRSGAENNEGNEIEEEETCVTYCIVGVVILVIIGVIIGIIYFLIQHPKFAHAMYKAIEADTMTDRNATSMKKITTVANQLERMTNETSTATII